ncbi:hypothetical protein DP73_18010 [Desulfosporosinus sp. HMP52]|uniref:DUF3986 family protein n=1 Tax=Desulfosporosinus sp. HMP52 TaxID=1487923 RepID=UPI00051F9991|nr:DUF3986 family protein [Desulfosporosinus sp. HMP52]KGK85829.1 hypothetical protein DP73_18010 [Desulfosporosinus sp. HMP52]
MSEISHWHIGYYDNGYCIEAIGFENDNESWDVYYPTDEKDKDLLKFFPAERDSVLGMLLFTVRNHDEGLLKFREWVENEYLPVLEQS